MRAQRIYYNPPNVGESLDRLPPQVYRIERPIPGVWRVYDKEDDQWLFSLQKTGITVPFDSNDSVQFLRRTRIAEQYVIWLERKHPKWHEPNKVIRPDSSQNERLIAEEAIVRTALAMGLPLDVIPNRLDKPLYTGTTLRLIALTKGNGTAISYTKVLQLLNQAKAGMLKRPGLRNVQD